MNKKKFIVLVVVALAAWVGFAVFNNGIDMGFKDAQKYKNER